jgi:hypothetical protein
MSSGSTATRKSSVASTLFKASSKFLHHNNNSTNNGSPKSVKRQKHSSSSDPEVCSSTDQSINNLNTHSSAATSSSADEDSSDVKLLLPISSSSSRSSNPHSSQGPAGKLAAAAAGGGGGGAGGKKRFVGVRQRPSGRWVAEIKDTTQKIRLWLGTFDSAEDGARAYDEAAWLLRGANTRTNFVPTCGSGASLQPGAVPASKAARLIRLRQIAAASKLGEFAASEVPEPKLVPEHHQHHHHHHRSSSSSSSSLLKGSSRSSTQEQLMNNRNQQSITVVEPALNPSSEEDEGQFKAASPQKLVPEHHHRSGSLKGSRSSTQDHLMKNRQQQSITVVVEPALNPPSSDEEDQFKAASPQSEQKLVPEQLHRNLKGSNPAGARSSTQEDQHVMMTQNRQQQPMIKVVEEEPLNHSAVSEEDEEEEEEEEEAEEEEEFIASDSRQSGSCDPASTSPHQPTGAPAELLQISCVRHHNVESDGEELPANDRRGRLKLEVGSIHLYPNSNDHSPVLKMDSKQSLTSSSESHCHLHLPMNSDPQAEESSPLPSPKAHAHRNHGNDSQKEISNEDDHQLQCFTGCKSEAGTEVVVKTEGSSLVDTDQYNRSIYSSPTRLLESHRSITSEVRSFAFSSIESFESYPPSHSPLVSFSRHQFTGEHHPGPAAMVVVPVTPVHEAQDSLIAPHFQFSCATNRDHVSLYPSSDCKELSASLEDFGSLGVGAHHENHHEASIGQLGHVMNSSGESLNQSYNESEETDHCGRSGGIKVHHHQVSTFSSEEVHYSTSHDIEMYQRELDRSNLYPKSAIRREREYADLLPEHSWPEFVYMDDTEMHESAGFFGVDLSCENSGVYTSAFDFSAELAIDRDSCTSVLLEEQISHQLPPHDDNEVLTLHRMDYEQSMSTNPPTSSFPKCVLLTEPSEMDYSLSSPATLIPNNPPLSPQEETHSLSISSSLLWRVAGSSSGASPDTLTGAEQSLSSDSAAGAGGGGECSTQDQALWSSMDLPPLCMVA